MKKLDSITKKPMKYDLDAPVSDFAGKPFEKKFNDGTTEAYTIRTMLQDILVLSDESDTGEIKRNLFRVSLQVFSDGMAEFTAEDIVFIKTRLEKFASPLAIGRIEEFLNK